MIKIAIDLDGTINASKQSIEFFSVLTHLLIAEHRIYILTDRQPNTEQEIAEELDYLGIEYNQIIITHKKAEYIKEQGISIFFENQDETFLELGEEVLVLKVRENMNFDFGKNGRWVGSRKTVRMIDEREV
jgi:uncharacterized HAD superfamily protein